MKRLALVLLVACAACARGERARRDAPSAPMSRSAIGDAPKTVSGPFSVDADGRTLWVRSADGGADTRAISLADHEPREVFGAGAPGEAIERIAIADHGNWAIGGNEAALVELITGGNACGPSYLLAFDRPTGAPPRWVSDIFAQCTYGDPRVESGRIVVKQAEGETSYALPMNAPKTDARRAPQATKLPSKTPPPASASAEVRMKDALAADGPITLTVDLDGDGKMDAIECIAGRNLICTLTLTTGRVLGTIVTATRFGVLTSTTSGMRDLVVEGATTLRWNGKAYE